MNDTYGMTLNSPMTREDWAKITDANMEHTQSVTFQTEGGKKVEFVKVKHGRWVFGVDSETGERDLIAWTCSECNEKYPWQPNYCPNCGAKMDGERKDEE